jgi:hypothetical protein
MKVSPSSQSTCMEKGEGRCLWSPCRLRPCMRDRQLGFWGASTWLPKSPPFVVFFLEFFIFFPSSSPMTWRGRLDKDRDPRSAWEGVISSSPCLFYVFQIILVLVVYPCCFKCCYESVSFVQLYCFCLYSVSVSTIYVMCACFVGSVKLFHTLLSVCFSSSVMSFHMLSHVYCCYEIYVLPYCYASYILLSCFK